MEAGLVGDSKSFVAREAMEHGHGHGGRPSRRLEILCRMRSHGAWPWSLPSRLVTREATDFEACLVD